MGRRSAHLFGMRWNRPSQTASCDTKNNSWLVEREPVSFSAALPLEVELNRTSFSYDAPVKSSPWTVVQEGHWGERVRYRCQEESRTMELCIYRNGGRFPYLHYSSGIVNMKFARGMERTRVRENPLPFCHLVSCYHTQSSARIQTLGFVTRNEVSVPRLLYHRIQRKYPGPRFNEFLKLMSGNSSPMGFIGSDPTIPWRIKITVHFLLLLYILQNSEFDSQVLNKVPR
jgi:hypothetical protein